jgi:hypothetical protein
MSSIRNLSALSTTWRPGDASRDFATIAVDGGALAWTLKPLVEPVLFSAEPACYSARLTQ